MPVSGKQTPFYKIDLQIEAGFCSIFCVEVLSEDVMLSLIPSKYFIDEDDLLCDAMLLEEGSKRLVSDIANFSPQSTSRTLIWPRLVLVNRFTWRALGALSPILCKLK